MVYVIFEALILLGFIVFHLVTAPQYGPTWDFGFHLEQAMVRMGEIGVRSDFQWNAYGWLTNIAPYLFSKLFPQNWFPWSYLLFSVLMGILGAFFFYLLVKEHWGRRIALLSYATLFLLPRFVGHIHTNGKDVTMTSFVVMTIYFLNSFLKEKRWWDGAFAVLFFTCAVNTKISVLQLFPVIALWVGWVYFRTYWRTKQRWTMFLYWGLYLTGMIIIPLVIFYLLWPGTVQNFFDSLNYSKNELLHHPTNSPFYAFIQLVTLTPIPILIFSLVGLFVLFRQFIKKNDHLAGFLGVLYLYAFLKYPIFRQPVIDDVRYFLEVFFPLSLAFVLGVQFIFRRMAVYVFVGIFLFLGYLQFSYHPYQIAYTNVLAKDPDYDFWGASYTEVFFYVNANAPPGTVISAPLAQPLGNLLIRRDLAADFNRKKPEESDIVIILNRPSLFRMWGVEEYFAVHTPKKIFTTKNGIPMSYLYENK